MGCALQLADPGIQGQVVRAVPCAGHDLEGFHDQEEHGHDHGHHQEHGDDDQHGPLGSPQGNEVAAGALAADGGVGFTGADELLVHHDGARRQQDHQYGHGVAHRVGTVVDEGLHPGGQHVEGGAVRVVAAQARRHAVGADGLRDGHDGGRQDGGQDQGQGDALQDLGLGSALDLPHLLQLRIDGSEGAGGHDVGEGVVVHGHHDDDGHETGGQGVGHRDTQAVQHPVAAHAGVAEDGHPGQGLAPGGDHVGDQDQGGQKALAGDVRADHEPGHQRPQGHGDDRDEGADDQRVPEGHPQDRLGEGAGQQVFPVPQGVIADLGAGDGLAHHLGLGHHEGVLHHGEQRDHDQREQQQQRDQDDHVERVADQASELVFEPFPAHRGAAPSFLCHLHNLHAGFVTAVVVMRYLVPVSGWCIRRRCR